MSVAENFFTYWYFHIPNLVLAALMYTLLGRFLLSLFFAPDSDKVIWRVFSRVTDPVVNAVATVTPAVVPGRLLVLFGFVWLLLARMALLVVLLALGVAPRTAG